MEKKDEIEENYHGVAPIQKIFKKIKKEYDKDPKGWNVLSSKDNKGNYDTFINKKPNSFWLKSKQLSPFSSLSMGSIIRNIDRDIDEEIGKKLSRDDMLRLFGMVVPINKDSSITAAGIENFSQKKGNHLKKIIKENHSNLEFSLSKRIEEEYNKKHPQRSGLYL
jgi:hypothetical protein